MMSVRTVMISKILSRQTNYNLLPDRVFGISLGVLRLGRFSLWRITIVDVAILMVRSLMWFYWYTGQPFIVAPVDCGWFSSLDLTEYPRLHMGKFKPEIISLKAWPRPGSNLQPRAQPLQSKDNHLGYKPIGIDTGILISMIFFINLLIKIEHKYIDTCD